MTEEDMCADIEFRLLSMGVSCVRELQCVGGWIDIAVRGGGCRGGVRIAAIECKVRSAWRKAVFQATARQRYCDEAWICEPFLRGPSEECLAVCRDRNIGVLRYEPEGVWPFSVIASAVADPKGSMWPNGVPKSSYMTDRYDEVERHWRRRLKPRAGSAGLIAGMMMHSVVIMDAALRRRMGRQLALELVTNHKPRRTQPVIVHTTAQVPNVTICGVRVSSPSAFEQWINLRHLPGAPESRGCKRCEEVWRVTRHMYRAQLIREGRGHICEYTWQEREAVRNGRGLEASSVLAG